MIAARIFASFLEVALPRSCVLCGSSLPFGRFMPPWPLCADCSGTLRPWDGERCESCGLPLISERKRCMRCRATQMAFDSAYPIFSYAGAARELVSAYKNGGRRSLAPFIALSFEQVIKEKWPERTVVPVPPRPERARIRGWDQVERVARLLERRGHKVERPLERLRSAEQKSLGRGERAFNAKKAYSLKTGAASPALPLLIDDIVTTCATLDACARALKGGGALSVVALAFAAD